MAERDLSLGLLGVPRPGRISPMQTAGVGGTAVYGGYIHEVEQQSRLAGLDRYRTYSEILVNVSIVAAGLRMFLALLGKVAWKVEAPPIDRLERLGVGDRLGEAEDQAALVEDMIYDLRTPWHRVVRRAGMFSMYGFSVQEWTAKKRQDGLIGLLDIEPRPQVTITQWGVDRHGNVESVVQTNPQDGTLIPLPRSKLVYLVDDSLNDSPEGLGVFRQLAEPARRLQRYEQLEGWGYELDLRGMPIGRAPIAELRRAVKAGDLTEEQANTVIAEFEKLLKDHVQNPNRYLLLDSMTYQASDEAGTPSAQKLWDFELTNGGSTAADAVGDAITRKIRQLARIMGTEHLLLGETSTGSLALSRDKTSNFKLLVDSTLNEVAETFEVDLVDVLYQLNGWDPRLKPTLKPDAVQFQSIEEVTGSLESMARAGAVLAPDDPVIGQVRDLAGLARPLAVMDAADAAIGGETPTLTAQDSPADPAMPEPGNSD